MDNEQQPTLPLNSAPLMPPVERVTLANGLQVLFQPMPASTSVGALFTVRVGARHETPELSGISHFLEHMVFRGSQRWSEDELRGMLKRCGGYYNGLTGREDTTYPVRVAAHDWRLALEWLAQLVFHPTLPAKIVARERHIIRQEKAGRESKVVRFLDDIGLGYKLDTAMNKALFPHPSFHQRIIGEDASLDRIDHDALVAHYRRYYRPNQCSLVVAGPIASDDFFELVSKLFGELPPGPDLALPPTPPAPTPRSSPVVVRGPVVADRVRIRVAARTVGLFHPHRWALNVLAEIIDERLKRAIRRERGLAYSISAGPSLYDDAGTWRVSTAVDARHQNEILHRIDQELGATASGRFGNNELRDAQTAMMGRWALGMEDSLRRASWLSQWTSPLAPTGDIPDYHATIAAVTHEDVAHAAATYLTAEKRIIGLHLPIVTAPSAIVWASRAVGYGAGLWLARRYQGGQP